MEAIPFILVFGSENAIQSDEVQTFKKRLSSDWALKIFSNPEALESSMNAHAGMEFRAVVLVLSGGPPMMLSAWTSLLKTQRGRATFYLLSEKQAALPITKEFKADHLFLGADRFDQLLVHIDTLKEMPNKIDENFSPRFEEELPGIHLEAKTSAELNPLEENPSTSELNLEIAFSSEELILPDSPLALNEEPLNDDLWVEDSHEVHESLEKHDTQGHTVIEKSRELDQGILNENELQHTGNDSEEILTLKRYALLKEREARENDSSLKVLKQQYGQLKEKLEKSESERRKLLIALDEAKAQVRTLEDSKDQQRHHENKIQQMHQEKIKDLQLRMDNAQFQASKAEHKLEEFRERVRHDLQHIRQRERELANRLELQKRDAEALLSAKDERLLHQKREMDRLEFEIETLQERLMEDTRKSEERAARLLRAVQSLKMAQGVLSEIDDEVLPGSSNEDEAA